MQLTILTISTER